MDNMPSSPTSPIVRGRIPLPTVPPGAYWDRATGCIRSWFRHPDGAEEADAIAILERDVGWEFVPGLVWQKGLGMSG
jgi:hypothetical protein